MNTRRTLAAWLAAFLFASVLAASPASASDIDVGIDSAEEVEQALDEVLAEVPVVDDLVEESAADLSDLEIDESSDVVVEMETSDGSSVEIPASSGDDITLSDGGSEQLDIELPGSTSDAEVTDDGAVVFEDPAPDTDLVVQAQDNGGLRVIAVIDGSEAPTSFDFGSSAGQILVAPDGAALMLDDDGEPLAMVEPAWAFDANGDSVPAWYTASGGTLRLHVDHSATDAYPVVADPSYHTTWYGLKTWKFNSSETQFLLDILSGTSVSMATVAAGCAGFTAGICAVPFGILSAISGLGRFGVSLCKNHRGVDIHAWSLTGTVWCSGY